jgi:hypothetical protein
MARGNRKGSPGGTGGAPPQIISRLDVGDRRECASECGAEQGHAAPAKAVPIDVNVAVRSVPTVCTATMMTTAIRWP